MRQLPGGFRARSRNFSRTVEHPGQKGELAERRKSTKVGGQGSQVSSPANGGRQTEKRPAPGYEFGDQFQSQMSRWLG